MAAHFISVLLTGFVIYTAWPGSSLFSWHPTLMTLGFGFFMLQAVLVFSPNSSLLKNVRDRRVKVTWHWVLNFIGLICVVFGFISIFYNKVLNGKPHFTTWHGCIGLAAIIYGILQAVGGIFAKYTPKGMKPVDMKIYHATSATLMISLASAAMALGMCSTWYTKEVEGTAWYLSVFGCGLLALVVTMQVTDNYLPIIRAANARRK